MIKKTTSGQVTAFALGRTIGPYVPYITYAFQVGGVLIDTGTRYAEKEFLQAIDGPVHTIINTHHHEDHIGNNGAVQERHGSVIYAHAAAIDIISDTSLIPLKPYQKAVWGRPRASRALAIGDSIDSDDCSFTVIPCRGHCDDHICLYDARSKSLFSGDMFCGVRNIYLRKDETFSHQLESVTRLASLDVDRLYCGLKGPVLDGGRALRDKLSFMKKLRDEVVEMRSRGMKTGAISRKLLGRENMMCVLTAGHFSKENLVRSILES